MVEHSLDPNIEEGSFGNNNWVSVDLGYGRTLLPTRYCVRQRAGTGVETGVVVTGIVPMRQVEKVFI